ncbi:NUDIX hydrolase [Demequina capsici]|uniref:NUDIX domain-containing protein n=1 Tax=Demequina capsici TaxID=3075620 RepID=A0AA96JEM0_9MICO|nr:NUDIX domain-containing protein [Demequina sp. OYTSA14]WNM25874.1 NUDIX domain-containing protein [Demequina sp. OYTSA14]
MIRRVQAHSPSDRTIRVVGVVMRDRAGRILTVRKRGTSRFMLVGGKPEPGETLEAAAAREAREEIAAGLDVHRLRLIGHFRADAANEPGHTIDSTVFTHPLVAYGKPAAEIEEMRWLDPFAALPDDLAPLLTAHVLPALRRMQEHTEPQGSC